MSVIDPAVHAALIVLAMAAVRYVFNYLGFDLTTDAYAQIAGVIVTYILSLFGYGLWAIATAKTFLASTRTYKPLFT